MMRILLIANAVGAIGDGMAGGVSDVLCAAANELCRRGHRVDILASDKSDYRGPARLIGIYGTHQPTLMSADNAYEVYPIVPSSLIANYWCHIRIHQQEYDVIINFCQDWLPFYLTPFIDIPVLHQVSVCDQNAVVTEQIHNIATRFRYHVGVLSHAQAQALNIEDHAFICSYGIDVSAYRFSLCPEPGTLIFCARISPEKGLEDAAEIAYRSGKKLLVCGYMQDAAYFERIMAEYGDTLVYQGFLDKTELAEQMGRAEALLCTHKCIEAFGLVVIEALACGTPVITYDRGGPAEIVRHGKTGFVVHADDVGQAVSSLIKLPTIYREDCRELCRKNFSLTAFGDNLENWIRQVCSLSLQLAG